MNKRLCECESSLCPKHGEENCLETATIPLRTIYGVFHMCWECAENMPKEFLKEGAA